jgi:hypothetical protein
MTQPVDGFTTGHFCSGHWPTNRERPARVLQVLNKTAPLPKRTPGEYTYSDIWKVRV